jgi:hypothetical protein
MRRNEAEPAGKKRFTGLHPMPRRGAGGMRKRDAVGVAPRDLYAEGASNNFLKRARPEEPADRQLADGDHKSGPEELKFPGKQRHMAAK